MPQPATTDPSRRGAKRAGGLGRVALVQYWAKHTFSGRAVVYGSQNREKAFTFWNSGYLPLGADDIDRWQSITTGVM